ncbi:MAG: tRNA lysidine(34) synthetase TilS [Candidatus Omnitrophota bacterium]
MKFINKVVKTILCYELIGSGDTIVAGVSGGADSVALLEILDQIKADLGLKIIAGHVNHGLRKGSAADERFVQMLCRQKNIPCETKKIHIIKSPGVSLEQAAREQRFRALISIAKKYHASAIALGHHQDDLAETVLMRIIRGSGLHGLQAILPKRTIQRHTFIRPLLETTKEEIIQFLNERHISFRKDPTNTDPVFLRNKIRHHLIPELKSCYNPKITQTLAGLAETSSLDYEFLKETAENYFKRSLISAKKKSIQLSIEKLQKIHPSLQHLIFRQAIALLKKDIFPVSLHHIRLIKALLNPSSKQTTVDLPDNLKVVRSQQKILIFKPAK